MRQIVLLATLLCIVLPTLATEKNTILFFSNKGNGKADVYSVDAMRLVAIPKWIPEQEPPLSISSAIIKAKANLNQKQANADTKYNLSAIQLSHVIVKHNEAWYYNFVFSSTKPPKPSERGQKIVYGSTIQIVVLMDGSIVEPNEMEMSDIHRSFK